MSLSLSDHESGAKYRGDYTRDLALVQERLAIIQAAHIIHRRSAVILFEGWDAAGKGGIIQRLCAQWDPRYFEVFPIGAPTPEERDRHFLWRFWQRLPAHGNIHVLDRSWYGRVAVERVEAYASEAEWRRGYDEINEFEAQLTGHGTALVKIFVHVTQAEQDRRLAARLDDPWKAWKTGADDYRNRARREDYLAAYDDMFARTHTRWAPWLIVDGNNKKAARMAALGHIAEQLAQHVPMEPPPRDLGVVALARAAFGYEPPTGDAAPPGDGES